jgi:hypothetical protein
MWTKYFLGNKQTFKTSLPKNFLGNKQTFKTSLPTKFRGPEKFVHYNGNSLYRYNNFVIQI